MTELQKLKWRWMQHLQLHTKPRRHKPTVVWWPHPNDLITSGLALMRRENLMIKLHQKTVEAPRDVDFHPFVVVAYTGPLLDVGTVMFLCSWLYGEGVMTPWTRKRLSKLKELKLIIGGEIMQELF